MGLTREAAVALQDNLLEPALDELLDDPWTVGEPPEVREWWVQIDGLCKEAGIDLAALTRRVAADRAEGTPVPWQQSPSWIRLCNILGEFLAPKQGDIERGTPL